MDLTGFRATLGQDAPPTGLPLSLQGLWWDARGDWNKAHSCAMAQDDAEGAALHAFLHRKEGDLPNAKYWYTRAGRPPASGTLEAEWETLAGELLSRHG